METDLQNVLLFLLPLDPMEFEVLGQEELEKVGSVLPGNSSDQCFFHKSNIVLACTSTFERCLCSTVAHPLARDFRSGTNSFCRSPLGLSAAS